jgi:hypothetical protein
MEIQASTIRVLEKTVPEWLKKLCTADFNAMNLSHKDRSILAMDGQCCMLGEMYDMSNVYSSSSNDEWCATCESFSTRIPENLGIGSYGSECSDGDIDPDYGINDILNVLDEFAEHIKDEHSDRMQKAIVPNEC